LKELVAQLVRAGEAKNAAALATGNGEKFGSSTVR
jgi:hypothetical protein